MTESPVKLRVQRIDTRHPLYEKEVDLRERVLLKPIGLDMEKFRALYPDQDEASRHIVITLDHPTGEKVVGCVHLRPDTPEKGVGKLSQMCVDPQRQTEGVGRMMIAELEKMAVGELGLQRIYCHAQAPAVGFYKKMGWSIEGEMFEEAGIEHYKMVCELDPPDPDTTAQAQTIQLDMDGV